MAFRATLPADCSKIVAVVGAGLSGIEAARVFETERGAKVVIFEKSDCVGGSWVTWANEESRVQVDPICFRPHLDLSPLRTPVLEKAFDSILSTAAEVIEKMQERAPEHIEYGVEVTSFETLPSGVNVTLRDLNNDNIATILFAELHIRSGSLSIPDRVRFPGHFNGKSSLVHCSLQY